MTGKGERTIYHGFYLALKAYESMTVLGPFKSRLDINSCVPAVRALSSYEVPAFIIQDIVLFNDHSDYIDLQPQNPVEWAKSWASNETDQTVLSASRAAVEAFEAVL